MKKIDKEKSKEIFMERMRAESMYPMTEEQKKISAIRIDEAKAYAKKQREEINAKK